MNVYTAVCVKCGRQFDFRVPKSQDSPRHPRRLCQICRRWKRPKFPNRRRRRK